MLLAGRCVPGRLLHHQARVEPDEVAAAAAGLQDAEVVHRHLDRLAHRQVALVIGDSQFRKKTSHSVGVRISAIDALGALEHFLLVVADIVGTWMW